MEQYPEIRNNEEIDLAELFANLWKKRLIIVVVALIGFLIGGGIFFAKWLAQPTIQQSSVELRFTFNGVQQGRYPNGQVFSISDIVSASILDRVYDEKNIDKYNLTKADFKTAISIAPFSTSREFIEARYKDQLFNNKLSNAEIAELNENYSRELQASTRSYAKLVFEVPASSAMPNDVQNSILIAIPEAWANESVVNYGVLDLVNVQTNQFDEELVEGYEYLVSTQYLIEYLDRLQGAVHNLSQDELARLQVDPITGATVSTIANDLRDIKLYHLDILNRSFSIAPVAKDLTEAKFYLQNEIIEKEELLDVTKRKARVLEEAYNRYINEETSLSSDASRTSGNAHYGVTAQYGDEFLTKLMSMGDELSDAKFKQDLLNRTIDVGLQVESITTQIVRLKRNLAQFDKQTGDKSLLVDEERVRKEIAFTSQALKRISDTIERISDVRKERILGKTSSLYALNSEPKVNDDFVGQIKSLVKLACLGLIAGGFLGLLIALSLAVVYKPNRH